QILVGDTSTTPQVARSYVQPLGMVNQDAVGGQWSDLPGVAALVPTYAHEAGHLMGLMDRYTYYEKQPGGSWSADKGVTTITSAQLAVLVQPRFPSWTLAQIQALLDQTDVTWMTVPNSGHETDIMGAYFGVPQQSDIDAIAQQAGLVVDVPP